MVLTKNAGPAAMAAPDRYRNDSAPRPSLLRMLQVLLQNDGPIQLNAEFGCAPGERLALVGPSGSGKTSVLRAIAGLLKSPHLEGRISVGDGPDDVWFDSAAGRWQTPPQRRVGLVFQHYALFPHLSAIDNVALTARPYCVKAYFDALFERMGLAGLEQRRPARFCRIGGRTACSFLLSSFLRRV